MSDDADRKVLEAEFSRIAGELRRLRGKPLRDVRAEPPYCSFCGVGKNQVQGFVQGPSANICDDCIEYCQQLVRDQRT